MARYSTQGRAKSCSGRCGLDDEDHGNVKVYWMPREICQSHEQESKACTLITILVVLNCQKNRVKFSRPTPTSDFIDIFSECIKKGNDVYEQLRESGLLRVKYLNIPEALEAVQRETNASIVEWVTLADSHGHSPYGAVIAQAPGCKLASLCKWYAYQLTKDTGPITCYELSFLYCLC